MIDRYFNRTILKNINPIYEKIFEDRNVNFINQYETPNFVYPTKDDSNKFYIVEHIWGITDKYYKIANKYYGDPRDWWVIAKFNNRPTEGHNKVGDIILIPLPLNIIVALMRG